MGTREWCLALCTWLFQSAFSLWAMLMTQALGHFVS